jgi:O-acetyl-ADP-ribose deacetylase (regulator of RNase III)
MSQMYINYLKGDATNPIVKTGTRVIAHVSNDIGAWGGGFVLSVSKKWAEPEREYRRLAKSNVGNFRLGVVQMVPINDGIWVANMIAQHDCSWVNNVPPIRYDALERCLEHLAFNLKDIKEASVHMPRIGCGLAGGEWNKVEEIINRTLVYNNIPVYVYDL